MISSKDRVKLQDMIESIEMIFRFTKGISFSEFEQNELVLNAVLFRLEVLGEAANQLSDDARFSNDDIPWRKVIGLRNRIIHGYHDINTETIWLVLVEELPKLLDQLNELVSF